MSPGFVVPWRERLAAWANRVPLPGVAFDPSRTVLLTGTSRSGTTWLGSLLAASSKVCLVNEPLSPKMPGLRAAGFSWRTYVDPSEEWPEGQAVFDAYFRGRGLTVKLLLRNGLNPWRCGYQVLKAVRANRLLAWIQRRYCLRGTVLLVRHPCAVVSSQMLNFGVRGLTRDDDEAYVARRLPHLSDLLRALKTEEERRALAWSLDQHAALTGLDPERTRVMSYERLVRDGRDALDPLLAGLDLPRPERSDAPDPRENSWQAREASVDHGRATVGERLGVWRRRLDEEQVDRILAVVEAVGIRGFGRELFPDVDAIGVEDAGAARGPSPDPGRIPR